MQRFVTLLLGYLVVGGSVAVGAEPASFPRTKPLSPTEAQATFRVQQNFRMALVAAEPLVADPIDACYDEDGRMYAVEMRGYPLPEKADQPRPDPISRIRRLTDDNGDGVFDQSTIFVDQLDWPTAVCPFRGGVFILDAPDLWYAKDTDGDGVADERRKVLTGFIKTNVQALANNLKWGLDGWIYGAASGNGGTLMLVDQPDHPPVPVTRRDFRFDPWRLLGLQRPGRIAERRIVEPLTGSARFGHSFDDWGQRFLCNIRNPIQHVVFPLDALERNPAVSLPSAVHDVAAAGETLPVFRISPIEPWREFRARRWVEERVNYPRSELVGAGFFTSSSGITIYRGGAYPPEFAGQAFVADVAANVVHRQVLKPDGVTFRGERVDEGVEFVASTDLWFRPVNFVNAPDGTLHVIDMYREFIEHPWSIPDDILAQLDLSSGNNLGRIWRLEPPNFIPPKPPRLSKATSSELVRHLDSPHSWYRETAQRLLLERNARDATREIHQLLKTAERATGRLHALWTLAELGSLARDDVDSLATDTEPKLRAQAIEVAARHLSADSRSLIVRTAAYDDDVRVRFAAALALINHDEADAAALVVLIRRDASNPWLRAAILSAATKSAGTILRSLCDVPTGLDSQAATQLLPALAQTAIQSGQVDDVSTLLETVSQQVDFPWSWRLGLWTAFATSQTADALTANPDWQTLQPRLLELVGDASAEPLLRVQAVRLLGMLGVANRLPLWEQLLQPQQPREVQRAALQLLSKSRDAETVTRLIGWYRKLAPALRSEVIDTFVGTPNWHPKLLDAFDEKLILATDVPPLRRAPLLTSKDEAIKTRAAALFGPSAPSSRQAALAGHQQSLDLKPMAEKGALVFKRECAQCHKYGGEGVDVGPPLASIQHRSPAEILIHILDPNREVGPNYVDYVVMLNDGRVHTGLLTQETDASITLLRPQGATDIIPRREIEEIGSSGKSLMPEGLEQRIELQEMADLIAYLRLPGR